MISSSCVCLPARPEDCPGPTPEVLVPHSIDEGVESCVENSNPVDQPQPGTGDDLLQGLLDPPG